MVSGIREIMWWVANKSKLLSFQEVFLKRRLSNFVAQVSQIWRRTIRKYNFTNLSTVKSAFCLKVSLLSGQVEHMWTVGFCPRFLFSDALTLFQFGGGGGRFCPPHRLLPPWFGNIPLRLTICVSFYMLLHIYECILTFYTSLSK